MAACTVTLRPARDGDYALVARLFLEMGTGDESPSLERWNGYLLDQWTVAELDGQPVGYMWFEVLATEGHVRQIVVDPSYQRRGIARALMLEGARRTREAGLQEWSLNVIPGNTPAVKLYESLGMRFVYESASYRFDWALIEAQVDALPELECVIAPPETYAATERAFGLAPGVLLTRGAMPSVLIKHLSSPTEPERRDFGVAVFDRAFPGCYPFRAKTPEHALTLLRGLHRDRRSERMSLVVENDSALDTALDELGARVQLRFVHFRGPLPPV